MPKVFAKALVFVVALAAVLLGVQRQDRLQDIPFASYKLNQIERLEPDLVFLGTSRTHRHVDAPRFDRLRGSGPSYNFGIIGARALELHYLAERLIDLPYLDTLVVELRMPTQPTGRRAENADSRRAYYHHDLRRARLGAAIALARPVPKWKRWHEALFRYKLALKHYSFVGQGERLFITPEQDFEPLLAAETQGFVALDGAARRLRQLAPAAEAERAKLASLVEEASRRQRAFRAPASQKEFAARVAAIRARGTARPSPLDEVLADLWLGLYRRAAERGVALYFVEQVGELDMMGVMAALEERLPPGRVIILNDAERYPEIFDPAYWFDLGHLNADGAAWLTDRLAEQLP